MSSPTPNSFSDLPYNFKKQQRQELIRLDEFEKLYFDTKERRNKRLANKNIIEMTKNDKAEIIESALICNCCSWFFLSVTMLITFALIFFEVYQLFAFVKKQHQN